MNENQIINIKKGDLLASIEHTCALAGTPVNLIGASVLFRFRPLIGGASRSGPCTIVDAANGKVRYDWVAGDTDAPGIFDSEFIATFPGAKPIKFPNYGFIRLIIGGDLS